MPSNSLQAIQRGKKQAILGGCTGLSESAGHKGLIVGFVMRWLKYYITLSIWSEMPEQTEVITEYKPDQSTKNAASDQCLDCLPFINR